MENQLWSWWALGGSLYCDCCIRQLWAQGLVLDRSSAIMDKYMSTRTNGKLVPVLEKLVSYEAKSEDHIS